MVPIIKIAFGAQNRAGIPKTFLNGVLTAKNSRFYAPIVAYAPVRLDNFALNEGIPLMTGPFL